MTIERALELLPQMRDSEWITALGQKTALYTDEAKEAFNLAISALEKQIPKRKLEKDQYNENLFTLRCPTCGTLIGNYNKRLKRYSYSVCENYCYICGQAIDFSEPQQEEQDG
jgi:hypothetical protein